jgi:predicted nucleotidyltransferase
LDIWVEPEIKNAKRVYEALKEFGAPLKDISVADFANKNLVYQIGVEPVRVDIIMGISGIGFNQAWRQRSISMVDGIKINIIGIKELIELKKRAGRQMDIVDIINLQSSLRLRKKRK